MTRESVAGYGSRPRIVEILSMDLPLVIRLLRLLGCYWPNHKGKWRLLYQAAKRVQSWPHDFLLVFPDGVGLQLNLEDDMHRRLFLWGTYEAEVTALLKSLLKPGDIFMDIGANLGYFSVLGSLCVGEEGQVHCFEPVPLVFEELMNNLRLAGAKNVMPNQCALGDKRGQAQIHLFRDLSSGHASLAKLSENVIQAFDCDVVTLDGYVTEHDITTVTLIKLDVEGAELSVLKGASGLLGSVRPPMLVVEANSETSAAWGYSRQDILDYLRRFDYEIYLFRGRRLVKATNLTLRHSENLLCLKSGVHKHGLEQLVGWWGKA